jgi:hypothetical protein
MSNIVNDQKLVELIREAFNKRIEQILEEETEKALLRVKEKIPEVISGLALELMKEFNMMENREHVMITVRKKYE